jgi:site-specific recombinase XerD
MKNRPLPLFDTLQHVQEQYKQCQSNDPKQIIALWLKKCFLGFKINLPLYAFKDYQQILNFLYSYRGSIDTFNSYRRELERLLHWCWLVQKKSVLKLKRTDIEAFIEFCQFPPKSWIGIKTVARFIYGNGLRQPNASWRPFIVKISKKSFQDGERAEKSEYELSSDGIKQIFAILSSFYNYLIQEEVSEINPVLQIRQKSKFVRAQQQSPMIRRLSNIQWNAVMEVAISLANQYPDQHERTLFIMNALYGMYLRISELVATKRWTPTMRDFFRDVNGHWWFKTVGKGNKMRQIAVSPTMLASLKRWRKHLGLSPLPSFDDQAPLIPKAIGKGSVKSTRAIRNIVQTCFNKAVDNLLKVNYEKRPKKRNLEPKPSFGH